MTHHGGDPGETQGFDDTAARAVELADSEARQLGHDRVGTEHLLLGLLTNDSGASHTLADAGVTLTAARSKVTEAVGAASSGNRATFTKPRPKTPRALRALSRSVRFAHARGSDLVSSDHLLMGVLDVEGIAGQVLRGLGVDVDSLRGALDVPAQASSDSAAQQPAAASYAFTDCPSCSAALDRDLTYRVVAARGDDGQSRNALVFACGVCGQFLGVGPA